VCVDLNNKRGRGRPIGGKAPASVREYWRFTKSDYRAKMNCEARKDLRKAGQG
jgi:hypothetical protein